MAATIKKITLWRVEVQDRPGALADVLEPLAAAKGDLQAVMGYRLPGDKTRSAIEVWPVSGKKLTEAAQRAGLAPASIPALLVSGPNKSGVGQKIARTVADAGINMTFLIAQVVGARYSAVLGFEADEACNQAAKLLRGALR